jgi:nitrite reductase/ring-hydroxylating ferredoxin subunit
VHGGQLKHAAALESEPAREIDLGLADQLLASGRAVFDIDTEQVLILRTRAGVFAIQNACPHLGHRLDDGEIERARVRCGAHAREYDLRSGFERTGRGRGRRGLLRYPVRVADGRLLLTPRGCEPGRQLQAGR